MHFLHRGPCVDQQTYKRGYLALTAQFYRITFQLMLSLATQAVVLGLWFAVIGGAIIELVRLRQS